MFQSFRISVVLHTLWRAGLVKENQLKMKIYHFLACFFFPDNCGPDFLFRPILTLKKKIHTFLKELIV